MNWKEYQAEVRKLARNPHGSSKEHVIIHWSLGLGGETGEVLELLKKSIFCGKAFNKVRLEEELGDVLWYLTALANEFDLSLEDIARKNIDKLYARYPEMK